MNTQSEALQLAEWLDGAYEGDAQEAAAELRRLHEANQELLEALKSFDGSFALDQWDEAVMPSKEWDSRRRAAIAKATGESA